MLPPHLQCVAASLILHAGLFSLAAIRPSAPAPLPVARRAALEASIAVEPAGGFEQPSAALATAAGTAVSSSVAAAPPARPAAKRPREALTQPQTAARARVHDVAGLPALDAPPVSAISRIEAAAPAAVVGDLRRAAANHPTPASPAGTEARGGPASPGAIGAPRSPGTAALPAGVMGEAHGPSTHPQLLARYLERVRARVAEHREYPYVARRASIEGTVCLRIAIAASGHVLGVTPTCGTSHEPLLRAALKSVSSAAPFPPLPPLLGARLTLDVPVVFQLDSL